MRYSDWQMRQLDIKSGAEIDRAKARSIWTCKCGRHFTSRADMILHIAILNPRYPAKSETDLHASV